MRQQHEGEIPLWEHVGFVSSDLYNAEGEDPAEADRLVRRAIDTLRAIADELERGL